MTANNLNAAAHGVTPVADEPSIEQVADYLRRHPDFLTRPDVLEAMTPPGRWGEEGEGVVDMQRFMLVRLREEIDNLRDCAQDLIETSRANMSSQTRTHAAVLAMLSADDFNHFLRVLSDDLPLLLDVDAVTIAFEPPARPFPDLVSPYIGDMPEGAVDHFLTAGREVVLLCNLTEDDSLFGSAGGLVRSAALARIRPGIKTPAGILALGSRANTFHPGQGTELVSFMARVTERCLYRWLEKEAL
ncbi:MAG: hypothetical protein A3G18_09125 [Rhodospirillales bacterium RIFCSPLOWO2_12_FULL_58_28]|nr:MAG: hypothetical protein A3H92_10745 [Rhodospirillales bacterium RIFCSPLOWO2_02_FULL_58_16]OHC79222.1 MAG: hypothetical protein A3G18_09125 [Rhodospirillales bacterium RIFCSPLOWO2_12_FULL_58_28]